MLPIIYFLKYFVRSGILTHAHSCRLRPERSALDHSAIPVDHVAKTSYLSLQIECRILILLSCYPKNATTAMFPFIYFLKYFVRGAIRTHAYSCTMLPERSALDHTAILTMSITHIYFFK